MLGKNLQIAAAGAGAGAAAGPTYVEDVFSTWLYTGNGSTQTITNGIDLAGEGGLAWIKTRAGGSHALHDTARGGGKYLSSDNTNAESSGSPLSAFTSSGFELTSGGGLANASNEQYASWTFRKAEKFFDVVTYTGTGANRTIAHSLGSVPGCIIVKMTSAAKDWRVQHRSLSANEYMFLNGTNVKSTSTTVWNNTLPTSSVFSVGTDDGTNQNGATYVAYLFAHDAGGFGDSGNENVISCGSFTGTGSVNLGWEPQWLLFKNATATGNWVLVDTMRGWVSDGTTEPVSANLTSAESSVVWLNVNSTGFSHSSVVIGSGTYIYIAIRRGPMKTPTDATEVFSTIAATASTNTTRTTGFPIDLQIASDRSRVAIGGSFFDDRLRGVSTTSTASGKVLYSNSTAAETTTALTLDFDNTGFKDAPFYSTYPMAWWNFRRAPGFFDVVNYKGTASALNVDHNLGVVPELIIVKSRGWPQPWAVWTTSLGLDGRLLLNATNASQTLSNYWSGLPSSTSFSVSSVGYTDNNRNGAQFIAYLFATCPGVSKVGSYTGTGTTLDVDCGFTAGARFVLIKRTDDTGDWYVWDTARGIISGDDPYLLLNSGVAEVTSTDYIDPLSSGFQISSTAPDAINASGGSFIFLAIA